MTPSDLLAAMKRTVEQLAAFNELAKALTSTLESREVLGLVMQKVHELLRPSNWSLLLLDEATGVLRFELALGEGAESLRGMTVKKGEGIAGTVFSSGLSRNVPDVRKEPLFAGRFDQASSFETRSVLAVPLKVRGRVLGVMELVAGPLRPPFSEDDLQTTLQVADYAAIAIDNARNFERVQELTISDEHTGLYNARHLRAALSQEVARATRFKHPLSLLFLDLDGFKGVNDTHGHLAGSALLREVGVVLQESIRVVDSAYRYGGDEFAVLLLETEGGSARVVAERIRDRLRERAFLSDQGLAVKLSASVGIASFPDDAQEAAGLMNAADRAMYAVKARGKNDVLAANEL